MESCTRMYFFFVVGCSLISVSLIGQTMEVVGIAVDAHVDDTVACIKKSACTCIMSDASGRYDFTALSGKPDEPFFPSIKGRNISETYSYDPCVPFTLKAVSGSKGSCDGVAGCRKINSGATSTYFSIAKHFTVEFLYDSFAEQLTLKYTNEDIFQPVITEVVMKCSNSDANSVTLTKAKDDAVLFELHSRHACLRDGSGDGLSSGSILCIIFSLSVIVYSAGGALFLVFVQNKTLNEAIPNKGFWIDLPGLIMDGAKFASNGFKAEPATHQRLGNEDVDIDDDDDDDDDDVLKTGSGGVPSGQSDGFTAVPV